MIPFWLPLFPLLYNTFLLVTEKKTEKGTNTVLPCAPNTCREDSWESRWWEKEKINMFDVFVLRMSSLSTERSQRHLLKMLKYNLIVQTPSNSCSLRVRTHSFNVSKDRVQISDGHFHSSRSVSVYIQTRGTHAQGSTGKCTAQHRGGESWDTCEVKGCF